MNFYKSVIKSLFVLLNVISIAVIAQENLRPLSSNMHLPAIPPNSKNLSKTTATVVPLNLPFFDDFSYAHKSPYPSTKNWLDSNVYINTGFAIAPLTLGVATFDGLNKRGYPYTLSAPSTFSGSADTLTSTYINLKATSTRTYSPSDSIFITFYYQAEGNGDPPEEPDSLCLDFFKPGQNKWQKVWGVEGYDPSATDTNFRRVRVAIDNTEYCDSMFQFRFRNKGTTSGSLDHWHLDYIQIKDFYYYADTILDDISFAYIPTSFLKNYRVMPYRQYIQALELGPGFRNYLRNNFSVAKFSNYSYSVKDELGTPIPTDVYGIFANPGFLPFYNNGYYTGDAAAPVFTLMPLPATTFTAPTFFTIQHIISTSGDTKTQNDTLTHFQIFNDSYAHDDGTAEQAYYLNQIGAKTAMRFTLNAQDTLKSVSIYFDPMLNNNLILNSTFRIMVWNNGGNKPGSLLYQDSTRNPVYLTSAFQNGMPNYRLTSCLPLSPGTYYIGIKQTTALGLNIGFDRNTNHSDATYYDIGNGWVQSAIKGSVMINPVMGCAELPVGIIEHKAENDLMSLYPNPAQNEITISYPADQIENTTLEIISSVGQLVVTTPFTNNQKVDISTLPDGMYFIYLKGSKLNLSPKKLIISR